MGGAERFVVERGGSIVLSVPFHGNHSIWDFLSSLLLLLPQRGITSKRPISFLEITNLEPEKLEQDPGSWKSI